MLISIHDKSLKRVAFLDNDKPGTLHFYNDTWHRYLVEATSTFDFTVPKPLKGHSDLAFLTEKNYVSFRHGGEDYLFNIMKVVETEDALTCSCENLNLELLNETASEYKASGAKPFVDYFNESSLVGGAAYTDLIIGVNEISDRKRTLSWEGTDTKLARLLSIVKQFDAECEFETKLNRDGTLDKIVLNVYKAHNESNQGVGRRRSDVTLYYGKEIKSVRRTVDKTGLYTAIRPIGKDGLTIASIPARVVNDANGEPLYTKAVGTSDICAPQSAMEYPPQLSSKKDSWILLYWSYDTDNPETLYSKGLAKLKSVCLPAITYEAEGTLNLDIGDTVIIHDAKFTPTLLLEARVSEQEMSFSNPTQNKNVFANFRALENQLSSDITSRLATIVENALPYTMEVLSSAGLVFKNGEGSTTLTPRVLKGQKDVTAQVVTTWQKNGTPTGISGPITIFATDIADKAVYRVVASGNDGAVLCSAEVTVSNVNDGSDADVTELEGRMGVAESKLTPDGLTTAISAAVTGGHEIITPNFVMDETGMVINGGGLTIQNNAGVTVLSADASGNLSMTGNLKLLGAQSMAICDNEAVEIGKVYFGLNRRQGYDYKCTQLVAYQALELHAGDINKPADTNQFGACYARGSAMIGWGYDKTTGQRWATLGATDDSSPLLGGVTVDTGSSPEVSATGCTKVVGFVLASGFSKISGYTNTLIYNALGSFCWLAITVSGSLTGGDWTKIATIPSGYRPAQIVQVNGNQGGRGLSQLRIKSDGTIEVWCAQTCPDTSYSCFYYL